MLDSVEKFGKINIDGVAVASTNRGSYLLGCSVNRTFGSNPIDHVRVAIDKPAAYVHDRRLLPHNRSPGCSCPRLVLDFQSDSFGILNPESFQSRTGDLHPITIIAMPGVPKRCNRVLDAVLTYINISHSNRPNTVVRR